MEMKRNTVDEKKCSAHMRPSVSVSVLFFPSLSVFIPEQNMKGEGKKERKKKTKQNQRDSVLSLEQNRAWGLSQRKQLLCSSLSLHSKSPLLPPLPRVCVCVCVCVSVCLSVSVCVSVFGKLRLWCQYG